MNKAEDTKHQEASLPWEAAFAKVLARRRQERGMSQTELARRATEAGLPLFQQQIQRIENLARPVRLNEAVVLARLLDQDPWVMIREMVDDASARDIVSTALEMADNAALRTIATIRDEWHRFSEAVDYADGCLADYIRYKRTRGAENSDEVEYFRRKQARLVATQKVLFGSVLARVLDDWDEPHLANAPDEDEEA
ncbi:helix-turn-helix domain-containing protein [Pseudarthrobacter sp.]|uniref:helix-turn-helix domain-containing protein n=1 Tax=Pseudarthrobacter sp. TaxID=1934409 RepID=UPI002FC5947D